MRPLLLLPAPASLGEAFSPLVPFPAAQLQDIGIDRGLQRIRELLGAGGGGDGGVIALSVGLLMMGAILLYLGIRWAHGRDRGRLPQQALLDAGAARAEVPPPAPPKPVARRASDASLVATARPARPVDLDEDDVADTQVAFAAVDEMQTARVVAWLRFQDAKATLVPLSQSRIRIGRHPQNDIRLEHPTVHRHHAVLALGTDGVFTITDLDTINRVFVNRIAQPQARLKNGDLVQLGEVRFRFFSNDGMKLDGG
ncbi:MAG: FHA domain-containing protein [Hyphomicrobiaceae bacterium]